jgi:long-chain acyl-CoA synthetase
VNISQSVERSRRLSPHKPALIFHEETYTYGELDETASRVANGLLKLGIVRGDRVALLLPNIPAWAFFYFGIQKIGAVSVSLNSTLKSEEVGKILEDCGAKAVVTTASLRSNVPFEKLRLLQHCLIAEGQPAVGDVSFAQLVYGTQPRADAVEMKADAPAAIVYTSGTTGLPKGAVLSHGNVVSNAEAKKLCLEIQPEDRLLLFLPLFHCFGQNAVLNSGLSAGATVVLHSKFDASQVLRSIRDDRITMVFGVPATFIILYEQASASDFSSVRYYFSAAANLPGEIEKRWQEKFGLPIHQGYGLTETSPFASYNHRFKHKSGSIGTPIEGVAMKVVDLENGSDLPPETTGEIVVRGPNVMLGYWNRPSETAEVIKDGWLHTGDIGRVDAEGYFFLEDRLKDMINVGGLKVYPAEVENIIYQHSAVSEAAVYGRTEPVLGESVMASIVLKPGHKVAADEIMTLCRQHLAAFKVPSVVEFVASLPRNPTGKILKRVLREESGLRVGAAQLSAASVDPAASRSAGSIHGWLKDWLAGELHMEPADIEITRSFFDYGIASVGLVKLTQDLGYWLGRPLDITAVWNFPTVGALTNYLTTELPDDAPLISIPSEHQPHSLRFERDAASQDLKGLSDMEMAEVLHDELSAVRQRRAE